jgi:O-antigen ligase
MRVFLVTLIFSGLAIFAARMVVSLQLEPARLSAFAAIVITMVLLFVFPGISLYLVMLSLTFYDPRFWLPFASLWLHQWIILVSTVLLAGLYFYRKKPFAFYPLDALIAALLLSFVISLTNSSDLVLSVKWITYFLVLVGGYYLLRLAIGTGADLRRIMEFLVLTASFTALISFSHPFIGHRVSSLVLDNPNALGNYLAMIFPLPLAGIFYSSPSPRRKTLLSLLALIILASIILTSSRSSWVGAFIGLLVLGVIRPRFKLIAVSLLILVVLWHLPPVQERLVADKNDAGVFYRKAKVRMAYRMFKERPILGCGAGGFQARAPHMEYWGIKAHSGIENLYMQILAEGGLLQALVFLGLVIYVTWLALSTLARLPRPGFYYAVVLGALASFWAALGIGVGENPLLYPKTNWIVGLFLGVIIKVRELKGIKK